MEARRSMATSVGQRDDAQCGIDVIVCYRGRVNGATSSRHDKVDKRPHGGASGEVGVLIPSAPMYGTDVRQSLVRLYEQNCHWPTAGVMLEVGATHSLLSALCSLSRAAYH